MIELKSEWYYDGFWKGAFPGGDIFGALYKKGQTAATPTPWILEYRFRYANSDELWDPADRKHWYRLQSGEDHSPAKGESMRQVFTDLLRVGCLGGAYHPVQGNGDAAMRVLETVQKGEGSMLHSKTVTEAELQEYYRTGRWPDDHDH